MTAVPRLPLHMIARSPRRTDPIAGSSAWVQQQQLPSEYKPPEVRLADALSTCLQLDRELKVLENSGHTRLGAFAKPLVTKRDAASVVAQDACSDGTDPNDSALLDDECTDPFYDQFFDDDGRSLYEQLLRCRMRVLALAKMVHGRTSLPYVRAEIELAEAYARINLWKQGHIHISTASELLKELDAQQQQQQQHNPHQSVSHLAIATTADSEHSLFMRALERLNELQLQGEGVKGQLTLDDALDLLGDCCDDATASENGDNDDDDNDSDRDRRIVSPLTCESLRAAFATAEQMHWQQLLLQLERRSSHFQRYIERLERAAPPRALQLVRSHFDGLDRACDGVVPLHTFADRLGTAATNQSGSSNDDDENNSNHSYLHSLSVSLQLLLERFQYHSITWPEIVELSSSRELMGDVIQALWPRLKLFMGRLFLRRGQLDDAVRQTQLAIAQHEQRVGSDNASLVPFYLVLAEALAVRFKQLGVLAQQAALTSATAWLETIDGSRALRARAIETIDDECARSGVVLRKKEAEARARDALVLEHSTSALKRPDPAMVEDAIELCTKAWSLQERTVGRAHVTTATVHATLAQIYALKGESIESVRCFTKAIEIYETACNGPVPASAFLQLEVARLHAQQRDVQAARTAYMAVGDFFVSFAREFAGADSTKRACCAQAIDAFRACLALLVASHSAKDEQRVVREAIARAARDGFGECSLEACDAAHDLGALLLDMGQLRSAETHLRTASAIAESHFGPTDRRARRLRKDVLDVHAKLREATLHPDEGGGDDDGHAWLTL